MEGFYGALVGAIIGGFITSIVCVFTLRFSYHELYAKTVSSSRNEWINLWRDEISYFIALADILKSNNLNKENNSMDKGNYLKLLEEYNVSKNKIIMSLNLNEKKHQEVYLLLTKIDSINNTNDINYNVTKECLMSVSRDLLKEEWERVKLEDRGKKYVTKW